MCGELTLSTAKERVCTCQLGKIITDRAQTWAYGVESQNLLPIPHLISGTDITLHSPVKDLRAAIHRRTYPTLTPQPNSTVKWRVELSVPLRLPWEELWPVISSAQVSGQVRSLLYFIMHRTLPLLSRPWISKFFDLPDLCLFCGRKRESYLHLFVSCRYVRPVWAAATTLLEALSLSCVLPLHDVSCLLGLPIYHHPPPPLAWATPEPPRSRTVGKWVGLTLAEVRGTALNSIWAERNRLLWSKTPRSKVSKQDIVSHFWRHMRLVAIGKRWPHAEDLLREGNRAVFFKHLWSLASPTISARLGGVYPAPVRHTSST